MNGEAYGTCCVKGCDTTRKKNANLTFHRIASQVISKNFKRDLIELIGRSEDASFDCQTANICSRHYSDNCYHIHKNGKKTKRWLKKGSLPALYLPNTTKSTEKPEYDVKMEKSERPHKVEKSVARNASPSVQHTVTSEVKVQKRIEVVQLVPSAGGGSPSDREVLSNFTDEEILAELSQRQAAFICACGMIFADRPLYYMHRSCHDPTQPHRCAFCGYEASDWPDFHTHFFKHTSAANDGLVQSGH